MSRENPTPVKWKLSRLKEHPRQAEMFGDLPQQELEALAEDMRKQGQRQPVEVLPDGIILAGHQRVKAARLLGWKHITVVVRHDLEGDDAAAEMHLINDNLIRRHLSPLGRARAIRRLMEIEEKRRPGGLPGAKKEELKGRIADRLGMSLRNVNRYLLILDTPPPVQAAFDRGEISLTLAGKVALLFESERTKIARRLQHLQEDETPPGVIAEFLTRPDGQVDEVTRAFHRLVSALRRDSRWLVGKVDNIERHPISRARKVLLQGKALLKDLLARLE